MSAATILITDLLGRGVSLGINDSNLQVDAPKGNAVKDFFPLKTAISLK